MSDRKYKNIHLVDEKKQKTQVTIKDNIKVLIYVISLFL